MQQEYSFAHKRFERLVFEYDVVPVLRHHELDGPEVGHGRHDGKSALQSISESDLVVYTSQIKKCLHQCVKWILLVLGAE
jgi:hypothetical protein